MDYNNQELLFGMEVLCWDEDPAKVTKGIFIGSRTMGRAHYYVLLKESEVRVFANCQPDPDSDNPVPRQWGYDQEGRPCQFVYKHKSLLLLKYFDDVRSGKAFQPLRPEGYDHANKWI